MVLKGFKATLTGVINGEPIEVTGEGKLAAAQGLTDGTYELRRLPSEFDAMLLSAFLICGYPNVSAPIGDTPNLFLGRSYEYRRRLRLRDGGQIDQRASVIVKGDQLLSRFHLTGEAHVPKLTGIEPVVESWEPYGPGGLRGHFTISWTTADGFLVTGDADSSYQLDSDEVQAGLLHRFILMQTLVEAGGRRLRELQTEGVFRSLPWALWIADERSRRELEREFAGAS